MIYMHLLTAAVCAFAAALDFKGKPIDALNAALALVNLGMFIRGY